MRSLISGVSDPICASQCLDVVTRFNCSCKNVGDVYLLYTIESFIYNKVLLIYGGICFLNYCRVCKVCKNQMKQIPFRKMNSLMILEYYCPYCDKSEMRYEKIQ